MGSRGSAKVNSHPRVWMTSSPETDHWRHRMRNATILIVRLRGTATEAIKNIVLAGIGTLVIVDTDDVSGEDLGTGFFFRDDDVEKKVP
jgi:molybdopterin/thiamine biosynthesis adenylyltransferase